MNSFSRNEIQQLINRNNMKKKNLLKSWNGVIFFVFAAVSAVRWKS